MHVNQTLVIHLTLETFLRYLISLRDLFFCEMAMRINDQFSFEDVLWLILEFDASQEDFKSAT